MTDEAGLKRLDDTALLMQRQEAADKGDQERRRELDAEVIRRWGSHAITLEAAYAVPVMSVLRTRDGVYRPSETGAFYDDDSFRIDDPEDKAEDRYVEYGIEPER